MSGIGPLRVPFPLTGPAHPETADGTGVNLPKSTIINICMQAQPTRAQAPPYVALCFEYESDAPDGHSHVSAVRTQDPDGGETRWTAGEFVSALRSGEQFVAVAADR